MARTLLSLIHASLWLLAALSAPSAYASACNSTDTSAEALNSQCYFALPLSHNGSQSTLHFYASEPPEKPNAAITTAIVVIHGHSRDANRVFKAALTAAHQSAEQANTLIVAPLFQVTPEQASRCQSPDVPAAQSGDLLWACGSWSQGGVAHNAAGMTSYQALDMLLQQLAQRYPSLKTVTVTGFSAGGQMVQRFASLTQLGQQNFHVRYVIASPGSWLYFDPVRPQPQHKGKPLDWSACTTLASDTPTGGDNTASCTFALGVPGTDQQPPTCPGYDDWKYGTQKWPRTLGRTPAQARAAYVAADITYLLGALDTGENKGTFYRILDKSCAAQLQGPYRLQRGLAYAAYDNAYLARGQHRLMEPVAGCAHSIDCVFGSATGRAALFPSTAKPTAPRPD